MNLETITMPKADARRAFIDYRRAVRERHSTEDAAIMRGYRHLALGRQIIHLGDAVRAGGVDDRGRPRLAVVRADAKRCFLVVNSRSATFGATEGAARWNRARMIDRYTVANLPGTNTEWREAQAIVPNVPPQYRPAHELSGYTLLFEAEWRAVAPRDPALLKHLGGELYVVLAMWDLTDLERAVIEGTRRA